VGGAAAPPSTLRYPLQDCGGRVPRLVEGTELIGEYQGSGPEASYIFRRADAQITAWCWHRVWTVDATCSRWPALLSVEFGRVPFST
jgi:hypothetical protein